MSLQPCPGIPGGCQPVSLCGCQPVSLSAPEEVHGEALLLHSCDGSDGTGTPSSQLGEKASLFPVRKVWWPTEEQGYCSLRCSVITFLLEVRYTSTWRRWFKQQQRIAKRGSAPENVLSNPSMLHYVQQRASKDAPCACITELPQRPSTHWQTALVPGPSLMPLHWILPIREPVCPKGSLPFSLWDRQNY